MSKNQVNSPVTKDVNVLIDEYLAKQDKTKMEVDQSRKESISEENKSTDYIWKDCWDREEYEKGFFKKLMEELTYVGTEQYQRLSNNSNQSKS